MQEQPDAAPHIVAIDPNHPENWKSTGTAASLSTDDARTWTALPDDTLIRGMVDMCHDRLRTGELVARPPDW